MGSSISTTNQNSQSDDPWWSIEHEDYILDQPNISELFALFQDNCENYNRRKVKVIKPELLSLSVQSTSENHTINEKEYKKLNTVQEQTLEEFKEELREKRMARQSAISDLRNEITSLKQQLAEEREIVRRFRNGESVVFKTKDASTFTDFSSSPIASLLLTHNDNELSGIEKQNSSESQSSRSQLAEVQLALQLANADNLSLTTELGVIRRQVISLKEVITCSKQMIEIREEQVNQLKAKLREIEDSLAERELKIMSESLRQEYDRQLANIRNLRQLYEERARVCAAERENLLRQISIKKDELAAEIERTKSLAERISSVENELETSNKKITSLHSECNEFKFENRTLKDEMAVINQLFSQMLMGFNGGNNLDIDQLTTMLEENRTLLNEIATKEDTSEGASLPKLLFDIVRQANNEETGSITASFQEATTNSNQPEVTKVATAQEIIGNLPKVWRVLMELLNHHKIEKVQFKENGQSEDCYKLVQTPTGSKAELSVSKTYIKLKDLILEKKSLQKETNKLKTLNSHLERRLNEQEKRLSTVSLEVNKTWHLVGKMQRQHRQLHTNEQILRYQLHQKRRLLNELKEELEYCRRKWAAARAKNAESQLQCDDLRREFAKRKLEDANNSAESGYSDGPPSDDDDPSPPAGKRNLHGIFINSKKIERMQSTSPTRSTPIVGLMLRGKSAPPTTTFLAEFTHTVDEISATLPLQNIASSSIVTEKPVATIAQTSSRGGGSKSSSSSSSGSSSASSTGAVPKPQGVRLSRDRNREISKQQNEESLEDMFLRISGLPNPNLTTISNEPENDTTKRTDRTERIQRLEEQCKSLIAQVIATAENREKLEIQLCEFQDDLPPAQKPVPLEEYLAKKNLEQKQDPFPETSELLNKATSTADKRHERLKKLEEESEQLMSKIKRTSDRTRNVKSRIEKIQSRSNVSREGSTDSTVSAEVPTEDEGNQSTSHETLIDHNEQNDDLAISIEQSNHPTSSHEVNRESRSDRLKRLEEEGKLLLSKLNNNSNKGTSISTKLDELHSRYGNDEDVSGKSQGIQSLATNPCEKSSPTSESEILSLTSDEKAYVTRRNERLKRLEEEGTKLLNRLSHTNERGSELASRLDEIHEQACSRSPQTDKVDSTQVTSSSSSSNSSKNEIPNIEKDSKSAMGKLEEVQRRLEQSKKLLSQLSSDPDLNPDCNLYRVRINARRTQSESEASEANSSNLSRLRINAIRTQSESEASHSENLSNSTVPQSESSSSSLEITDTTAEGNQSEVPQQNENSSSH